MINILLLLGVKLENGPNQESNNTLITVTMDGENSVLFCSTDRESCCNDELNIQYLPGSWFLPNRSKISSNNTQSLHNITLRNQTMGLNISPKLPTGIYHCEMMDREDITYHLYAGIYSEDEGIHVLINIIWYYR